ncbi:hypothetical protein BLNAU_9835 [Blattamonas nauphoetae]|uniref:Uncharacterized protein n=1 Tax=Blattamonas nauphoetae TaxID=2049346 RepID=A0ABQ9XUX3_9EUKA|nr:hypothetical protein BLNAU_9835 [Blattamonas nauphoetae]
MMSKILTHVVHDCSAEVLLPLVEADLIPQLINTLNPLSLSPTEAVDIHTSLLESISHSVRLTTPYYLAVLGIEDGNEQQAVHTTVFQQVLVPSEKYIRHLCVNRYSIIDGDMSSEFMFLLAHLLQICPYYQPTMDLVLHMPVVLPIPSCLTIIEKEQSIFLFLYNMNNAQWEWNETKGVQQQMWKTVHRMLRMEGIEALIEEKLQNDQNGYFGRLIVQQSIRWHDQQGVNPQRR